MSRTSKKHYIDNVKFSEESAKHAALFRENRELGLPPPRMSDYIGNCLLLLATKIASMPSFSGYTYRDEFISDGVEIAIRYFYNFDPTKISDRTGVASAGAHSFFSQIMIRRFFKTRSEHKLNMFLKEKFIVESDDLFAEVQLQDEAEHSEALKEVLAEMSGNGYVAFDEKQKIKKAELKAKQTAKKQLLHIDEVKEDVVLPLAEFF